ncbi:MAG: TolA-binding protein [Cognaticolwellia sp.]|jgi:TolA-binding protein
MARRFPTKALALGAALALILGAMPAAYAADLDTMAQTLSEMRRQVEQLSADLTLQKEDLRGRLRALDGEKAELQVQLRQQELRGSQLQQALDSEKAVRSEIVAEGQALTPAVVESIAAVRGSVKRSMPFRLQERLDELDKLEAELAAETITPREAAQRLWSFSEDELRLSKENAIDRQVITLDGEEVLVDVARLGMVAMYYKTESGQVGWAVREAGAWEWKPTTNTAEQQQILELFDALEKQIRVGFFELPSALVEGGAQ